MYQLFRAFKHIIAFNRVFHRPAVSEQPEKDQGGHLYSTPVHL